jgi:pyruvate formate lyase activating enzyme
MLGRIFEIREFTLHDGPGVRTTVFFKGCPLRCAWCHNPEGQDPGIGVIRRRQNGEVRVCGADWTVDALVRELLVNADFLAMSSGGITFSGGEPLMQAPFILELVPALRASWSDRLGAGAPRHHLAVETSGHVPQGDHRRVVENVDLVYQDLKHPFPEVHIRWTGVDPKLIHSNLAWLKESGRRFVARIPLIPGVNDGPAELNGFARMLEGARGLERVELLPYNNAAGAKYPLVGREWNPGFDETAAPNADTSPFASYGIDCVVM